ncbi:MAG: hypothetical protein V3R64_03780 [Sphingomonadales bacterium]
MPENRRRRIIKPYDPFEGEEGQELYDEIKGPLLERKIYVPMSLILGGFFAIIVMSISLTYIVISWSGDTLELEENGRLVALREAAAETTLDFRESPSARPLAVERPQAAVDVGGFRQTLPNVRISGIETPERQFQRQATSRSLPPVVDLSQVGSAPSPAASIVQAAIPPPRRQAASFERALRIAPPSVNLTPGSFTRDFETTLVPKTTQKLMMRRFAKATSFPEPTGAVNPLTIPATGRGLAEKNREFSRANGTTEPVSDMAETRQAGTGLSNPAISPLAESGRNIGRPLGSSNPVVDLNVAGDPTPRAVAEGQPTDQKLLRRRFAKATALPEAEGGNNPLTIPLEGGQVSTRSRTFSRALGLAAPTTDLVLSASILPGTLGPAVVPNQKLMSRRYAKTTSIPERLPFPDPIENTPVPDPVIRDNSIFRSQDLEPWQRYAASVPMGIEGQGRIVIIIDDMGNNSNMAARLAELEGPLNFAFFALRPQPFPPNFEYSQPRP